jgi:hypothetical protein
MVCSTTGDLLPITRAMSRKGAGREHTSEMSPILRVVRVLGRPRGEVVTHPRAFRQAGRKRRGRVSASRPDPMTFDAFLKEWFKEHAERACTPKTVE